MKRWPIALALLALLALGGCRFDLEVIPPPCDRSSECRGGRVCVEGRCVRPADGAGPDGADAGSQRG